LKQKYRQNGGDSLSTRRIEAFSDGVLSIVITLLVLQLSVPVISEKASDMELTTRLLDMLPKLFSYVISFAVVGIYWVGHHNLFHFITRADRVLLWLNNLFLLCVGFIPFPAALLGAYGTRRVAVIVYGASLVCTGLTLACIWLYATHGRRLVDRELSPVIVTSGLKRILLGPILYALSVAACFLSVRISLMLYVLVPIIYILPGRIDRYWHKPAETRKEGRA
jgi:TMEM175 potassium channel family protein